MSFTTWLRTWLTKEDRVFFCANNHDDNNAYNEPLIRRGFEPDQTPATAPAATDCKFLSLGIVLLELCFGKRLQDHPFRKKYPPSVAQLEEGCDLMAAIKWSHGVCDEGKDDYAAAVKWCFTAVGDMSKSWRGEIIKNVIQPLERCQDHFNMAATT
jgi:hypothetical protein